MEKEKIIELIIALGILIGLGVGIFIFKWKEERELYSGYKEFSYNPYKDNYSYRALIENANETFPYQTNMILVYLFEESVVLLYEGLGKKVYINIFDSENISSLRYEKKGFFRTKLIICHKEKGVKSPYEVIIISRLKDYEFLLLDDLCESVNK